MSEGRATVDDPLFFFFYITFGADYPPFSKRKTKNEIKRESEQHTEKECGIKRKQIA